MKDPRFNPTHGRVSTQNRMVIHFVVFGDFHTDYITFKIANLLLHYL